MIFERTFIKNKANFYSCKQSAKKTRDKIKPLSSQKVGFENGQPKVTWPMYFIMLFGTGRCHSQHVILHPKE
jgi:hypothetical protein